METIAIAASKHTIETGVMKLENDYYFTMHTEQNRG
jgi:hypothetical protein